MVTSWPEFFEGINNITIKVTPGCNLKCTYCNVEAATPKTPKMTVERHRQIADLCITNTKSPFVGLEFHGGEPLLLPDEWFEETVGYARALAKKHGKILDMPIVTNATMINDKRLQKLVDLGIRLCLSCDGPPAINDELRGGGERVARALGIVQRQDVPKGIITVLSGANWNRMPSIMDWFSEVGVDNFMINFLQPQGRGLDANLLSGEQMFTAMKEIFEHMYETEVSVSEANVGSRIERFARGRKSPPPLACNEYECQAGKSYIAIDTFGSVHPCGSDVFNHGFGHLDQPFDNERYQNMMANLHDKGAWVARCFGCNAKQICDHSCPTSDKNTDTFRENECLATKLLWDYFCDNAERVHKTDKMHKERRREIFQHRVAERRKEMQELQEAMVARQKELVTSV